MLRRYVEQLLSIYNFIDGLMIVNAEGYVEYFGTFRPDVNNLKEQDVLGKHILEVYPNLTEETSSLLQVLRQGKPISNQYQTLSTFKGQNINAVNTTMPIKDGDVVIGAVDVSRYLDSPYERQNIALTLRDANTSGAYYTVDDIITNSQSMMMIKERIRMVADTDSSVLIYGETGTGKELVAQSIHTSSCRRKKKFVSQNCAAIPANLLESILFGTTKGSYTGAENRPGLFEIANGGTLFLDEINSMEMSVQAKILKAIEEKRVTRLGGLEPIPIEVKIVSAVNENPIKCISSRKLREDLFYRLSVVQLTIPPLRERINDLFFMVSHFIREYNIKMNRSIIGIDERVEAVFREYDWPGNVRELKNVIEGAFNVASSDFIQAKDLPEYLLHNVARIEEMPGADVFEDPEFALDRAVADYESSLIRRALSESDNLVEAAKKLKISKQSLHYKMGKYGIDK